MKKPNKIEQKVISWGNRFPIDRWWREKHKVSFMSTVHRESSFIDQLFEYYEDRLVNEIRVGSEDKYIPNTGDFLTNDTGDIKSTIKSLSEEFEKEFLKNE